MNSKNSQHCNKSELKPRIELNYGPDCQIHLRKLNYIQQLWDNLKMLRDLNKGHLDKLDTDISSAKNPTSDGHLNTAINMVKLAKDCHKVSKSNVFT